MTSVIGVDLDIQGTVSPSSRPDIFETAVWTIPSCRPKATMIRSCSEDFYVSYENEFYNYNKLMA